MAIPLLRRPRAGLLRLLEANAARGERLDLRFSRIRRDRNVFSLVLDRVGLTLGYLSQAALISPLDRASSGRRAARFTARGRAASAIARNLPNHPLARHPIPDLRFAVAAQSIVRYHSISSGGNKIAPERTRRRRRRGRSSFRGNPRLSR